MLLDGAVPEPVAEAAFPRQLRQFLVERTELLGSRARRFPTREAALAARSRRGLGPVATQVLAQRSLRRSRGQWSWRADPRLRGASAVKLTAGQIRAVLEAIEAPSLLLLSEAGHAARQALLEEVRERIARLTVDTVPGGHHFHLEEAATAAARIARFLAGQT